jgi:hypothetical protein
MLGIWLLPDSLIGWVFAKKIQRGRFQAPLPFVFPTLDAYPSGTNKLVSQGLITNVYRLSCNCMDSRHGHLGMFEKKQPWNPFPLASLSAADKFLLSPCATQIIHYLAARSNHTGWTCVGQDRVAHDIRRSRDYVTKGFKELRDKKVISTQSRGRKSRQGDACIITQELLPEEWRKCNPTEQEDNTECNPARQEDNDICNPDFEECNPAQQEDISKCNPDLPNVILPSRTKPYSSNLAQNQEPNLTVQKPKTPNQPINQPTNPSEATPPPSLEETKPLELFTQGTLWDFHTVERELDPMEKQAWVKAQIMDCWWDYREPTEQDLRFMYESLLVLHTKHLLPKEAIAYAKQHFDPKHGGKQKTRGMVIRDCRGLWKAVCGPKVSQTNGLLAQYSECWLNPCEACKSKQGDGSTEAWLNPNLQTHARRPIAPPPPPITTCGECGTKFEATGAMAREKTCQECKQKKSDASFLKLLLEGRITPESDKATYERLVKAGKITDGIKAITKTKNNLAAFLDEPMRG